MSEFVFLYRIPQTGEPQSPRVMQERMKLWRAWMQGLEEKGRLVSAGQPLANAGAVVSDSQGNCNDGPYAETKDIIMGFSIVSARDLDEAVRLSLGCPILASGGGVVEVRPVLQM